MHNEYVKSLSALRNKIVLLNIHNITLIYKSLLLRYGLPELISLFQLVNAILSNRK